MSTTQDSPARGADTGRDAGPDAHADPHPDHCENAREYVLKRLDPAEPMSPSELAEEYDCSNIHMQKTLADLADSDVIERVSRGNYVADNVGDALEAGKDALGDAADTAADALDQLGGDGDSDGDADAPAAALPMDPRDLGKILAVAVALWLLFRAMDSDDDGTDGADLEDDQGDPTGGLLG